MTFIKDEPAKALAEKIRADTILDMVRMSGSFAACGARLGLTRQRIFYYLQDYIETWRCFARKTDPRYYIVDKTGTYIDVWVKHPNEKTFVRGESRVERIALIPDQPWVLHMLEQNLPYWEVVD